MDSDGSNKLQLTEFYNPNRKEYLPEALQITEIAWSPDDKRIIFGHASSEQASSTRRFVATGGADIPSSLYVVDLSNACME